MSIKQKLSEILEKLKSWAGHSGNDELHSHINELENEINQITQASAASDPPSEGGNSPEGSPDLP